MAASLFIKVDEVCRMLAVSRAEVYRINKRLNAELAAQGYIVMTGRVNRRYLERAHLRLRKRRNSRTWVLTKAKKANGTRSSASQTGRANQTEKLSEGSVQRRRPWSRKEVFSFGSGNLEMTFAAFYEFYKRISRTG